MIKKLLVAVAMCFSFSAMAEIVYIGTDNNGTKFFIDSTSVQRAVTANKQIPNVRALVLLESADGTMSGLLVGTPVADCYSGRGMAVVVPVEENVDGRTLQWNKSGEKNIDTIVPIICSIALKDTKLLKEKKKADLSKYI